MGGIAAAVLTAGVAVGADGRGSADRRAPGKAPGKVVTAGRDAPLRATIRRTSHGIPHILADDLPGAAYGYGYAFAEDNLCVMADTYVTVRAERSKFFGADKTYASRGNGTNPNNLNSDFFFQRVIDDKVVEKILDQPPPHGPLPALKEGVRGYVAGYNQYLSEVGVDNLPDPACRGKPWVRPITEMDAYRRFYQLGLLASAGVAIDGIGGAAPPGGGGSGGSSREVDQGMIEELGRRLPLGGIGSNAYGLGREATANGRGMILGNPHFPWDGPERFYQAHLTVPGEVDVSGGSLFGVPLILIGHNRTVGWSHTVSTAFRFTPFELKLQPGSPTTYMVDGQPRQMTAKRVTVQVMGADGKLEPRSRTLYFTHHGPILTSILGLPIFPWTHERAYAMGDANATNFRYLNHFFEKNRARNVAEVDQVLKRNQGIPWVNTIAADSTGRAYYADISVVPHVTNEHAERCNVALGRGTYSLLRLPVLDGSRRDCEWGSDPDAVQPGILGPGKLPSLFRDDYVLNSNDSYWLTTPRQPLTGFSRIIGDEGTPRSLRTRSGLVMAEDRLAGRDGQPGNRFTLEQLMGTVTANRQHAGELWRNELVAMCKSNPVLPGSNGPVDVSAACPVLERWDVRDDLDSRGALLFRRFASRALSAPAPGVSAPDLWRVPFSASDAVNTPRGLNTDSPRVRQALADAVSDLRSSAIPLDARLGDWQYEQRGDEKIPIHGGPGTVGVFNAINVSWSPGRGYPDVPHGTSFIYAAQFTDGCPEARSFLTYSQSTNKESRWHSDQTRLFSRKQWVKMLFCERDILADPNLEVTRLGPPKARRCTSRRRIVVRLPRMRGERPRSARIYVRGRRVRTLRGRNLRRSRSRVTLRGLPRGRYRVRIVVRMRSGRSVTTTRTYRTCASKKKATRRRASRRGR